MEPSHEKPMDESSLSSLVADFNAITQNTDQQVASHYLEMSNYDLNKAITLYMENPPSVSFSQPSPPIQSNDQLSQFSFMPASNPVQNQAFLNQVVAYKDFYREQERKAVDYEFQVIGSIFKTSQWAIKSAWNKLMPIAIRGETPGGEEFTCFLRRTFGKIRTYNFIHGTFAENIEWASSKGKMLLVFIFSQEPSSKELQRTLLTNEALITYINENFIPMGLLQNKAETNKLKADFPEIKEPCLLAFRRNLFEKPLIIEQLPISNSQNDPAVYLERLKGVMNICQAQIQEEEAIKKKALQEIKLEQQSRYFGYGNNPFFSPYLDDFGDQGYQPPRMENPEMKKKLEQDRMLKRQQEEEYKIAQRLAEEQSLKKQREIEEKRLQEERMRIEEEEKLNLELIQKEALRKKRALLKPEPDPSHSDIFEVLFRLPNGNKITRRFLKTDQIEDLYTFVGTLDDLPFRPGTNFDILRTMPPLNLSDKRGLRIFEVFEDSGQEMFHVREID